MSQLRIIFSGSGAFGIPTLKGLIQAGHEIVQVISQPDRPAGRGRALTPTPVAGFALTAGLPVLRTSNINVESLPPADLMTVIAFGQKIAPNVVNHPRLGSINLHASRLPKFRGAAPINWAILGGETHTGNSVIRLAERMDAGAVLAMSSLEIGELETAGELHDRLAEDGAPLMLGAINSLAEGTAVETVQDESQATMASKLSRESAVLDWTRPAVEIARRIRGLYPWPGCRVRLVDQHCSEHARLTLVRARSADAAAGATPGQIQHDGRLSCGEGAVEIIEVQPEGKRPMPLASFRNGHPWEAGMRLESI